MCDDACVGDLGFLQGYAVVRVFDPSLDVDPLHRSKCLKVYWDPAEAQAEAARLNVAHSLRSVTHLVEQAMVEVQPGDPRFDGVFTGAAYIARRDDDELTDGDPRYMCHWEVEGSDFVSTNGFDTVEAALAWARQRAPSVTVQLYHADHYEAGSAESDLPRWPPPGWSEM